MFPSRYFPSRYFPTRYWTKELNGGVYPTPNIWVISSRERQWTIDYYGSQTSNTEIQYSWNLPTRVREWVL